MLKSVLFAASLVATTASANFVEPNHYECKGKDIQVGYSTSSFLGVPSFGFSTKDSETSVSVLGEEISTVDTSIGRLVTVTTRVMPDALYATATLVVPHINLDPANGLNEVKFKTTFYTTDNRMNIGGPAFVKGLVTDNTVVKLNCVAQKVMF